MVAEAGKIARSRRGETLVETIVCFGVLMLVLACITALMATASNMNTRTAEKAETLSADMAEADGRVRHEDAQAGSLVLDFSGETLTLPILVDSAGDIGYFYAE